MNKRTNKKNFCKQSIKYDYERSPLELFFFFNLEFQIKMFFLPKQIHKN